MKSRYFIGIIWALLSSSAWAENINKIFEISKEMPESVKLIEAPDISMPHYKVLDNTKFSYKCYVPYTLPSKLVAVEVCEIQPVKLEVLSWPETEVIHLIRGTVKITEDSKHTKVYKAGDIFVLPEGFKGIWHQEGVLLKVTVRHPLFWQE